MHRSLRWLAVGLATASLVAACQKAPVTGREQFNFIPQAQMNALGKQTYQQTLAQSKVERSGRDPQILEDVGHDVAGVANKPDYAWEFSMIQSKDINAWCLPGGYVGVYTGILPVMRDKAGMAFVLGHEAGHAIANHGGERMSQQLAILGGLEGLNLYLSGSHAMGAREQQAVMAALGVGAEVGVVLPFSRTQESEADVIGMMLMSKAGYPPRESIAIWDRMDHYTGGGGPPAFLSDHPSSADREKNLRDWMPKARKRYERSQKVPDALDVVWPGGQQQQRVGTND